MTAGPILITGGAGFIGCNAAARWLRDGRRVIVIDDLSRAGTDRNLRWLEDLDAELGFEKLDIRDDAALSDVVKRHSPSTILHLAAQVAVTTSVVDPRSDFDINALGTFNVLEATRRHAPNATLIYASTNKVYGHLDHLELKESATRYELVGAHGVDEESPLDFYSPYGCSKGAADQYTIDYARIYGMRSTALRQSCIYGHRQFGIEDQGWVAWFMIAHLTGKPITVYGNGKQVRDLLFVDDLIDLYEEVERASADASGNAFNVGGGAANALSLLEFFEILAELSGRPVEYTVSDPRPGDQPFFVADVSKAREVFGWVPLTPKEQGLESLYRWISDNRDLFS